MASRKKTPRLETRGGVEPFRLGGWSVEPGTSRRIDLRLGELYNQAPINIVVFVLHGTRPGPVLWVSGGVHGDELAGIVATRQVTWATRPEDLAGTLLAIPCVNELGTLHCQREFPDGRDLNRCFPGSRTGSLASRVARAFLREIAGRCTHGIDIHTAGGHRDNLPQIRANLDDPVTRRMAQVFGTPVVLHANLRDGSLRQASSSRGIPTLLFEGGKALRHEPHVVDSATHGVLRVMADLGMIPKAVRKAPRPEVAWNSSWARAPRSGYFVAGIDLGDRVRAGQELGVVHLRPHEDHRPRIVAVRAVEDGIVIGIQRLPLVHVGDPLVHLADVGPRRARAKASGRRESGLKVE
jgi:predicted deacylase